METTTTSGIIEEMLSPQIRMVCDYRTDKISVLIDGKCPIVFHYIDGIHAFDIEQVKKHIAENFQDLGATFERHEINSRTSISYSPEINLIRINSSGQDIMIPGAGKMIDFLNRTRKDYEQGKRLRRRKRG
jgi:hypothetical protein